MPETNQAALKLIQQGIDTLFQSTDVLEVRVPKAGPKGTISGNFEVGNPKLVETIADLSGRYPAVYYILNPINPALLSRAKNRIKTHSTNTATDADIISRIHLLIDCDPIRPAGISSTDAEKETSRSQARAVLNYLTDLGWPKPIIADSGNGYHLLYNIDLPNDKPSADLVKGVLKSLAAKFDSDASKVDQGVFNAARIVKAYGSLACKGDSTEDRPHRLSKLIKCGDGIIVSVEQLQALAADCVVPVKAEVAALGDVTHEQKESFEKYLGPDGHNIEFEEVGYDAPNHRWAYSISIGCPYREMHTNPDSCMLDKEFYVYISPNGPQCKCVHSSCEMTWSKYKNWLIEKSGKNFPMIEQYVTPTVYVGFYDEDAAKMAAAIAAISEVPSFPETALNDSWAGEMAKNITEHTFIPPCFAYSNIKTALGSIVDGLVGFPNYPGFHTRHYNVNVSQSASQGKSQSQLRTIGDDGIVGPLTYTLQTNGVELLKGGLFGSGENGKKILSELSHRHVLIRYDELVLMFQKISAQNSTLGTLFLEMFEAKNSAAGSLTNGHSVVEDVSLSFTGSIVQDNFKKTLEGSSAVSSGLLSRFTLTFAKPTAFLKEWPDPNPNQDKITALVKKIVDRVLWLKQSDGMKNVFVPEQDSEAKLLRGDFLEKFAKSHEDTEDGISDRLDSHFRRDLLLRAVFSDEMRITAQMTQDSIDWVNHQLALRKRLWVGERKNPVEQMALRIRKILKAHICATKRELLQLCNVEREGSDETFNRAIRAMHFGTHVIEIVKTNRKGGEVFALVKE